MKMIGSKICTVAAAAVVALGLSTGAFAQAQQAQGGQPGGDQGGGALGYQPQGNDQNAAGPSGATRQLQVPVLYVTGIEVIQGVLDPKEVIVRVTGLTSSAGWTAPELIPFYYGKPTDDVLDLQFIATSPEQSQKADGFVPITATFELDPETTFKGVRVRAYANALELKGMTGSVKFDGKVANDCKECAGKKFVDKGQGQAGPGIVYGGDLTPDYRPIGPTHGVKGEVHNPNRINLILDDQNKITMAFWE
ncbi:MAG TPA: hypothetical protein VME45_00895 [Stellaceae bacterium]|nr:hypothetical protein [Stellaceae bacterium]